MKFGGGIDDRRDFAPKDWKVFGANFLHPTKRKLLLVTSKSGSLKCSLHLPMLLWALVNAPITDSSIPCDNKPSTSQRSSSSTPLTSAFMDIWTTLREIQT